MAQRVRVLTIMSNNPGSIPRTHTVVGERMPTNCPLTATCTHTPLPDTIIFKNESERKGGKRKRKRATAVASGDVLWLCTQETLGSITSSLA